MMFIRLFFISIVPFLSYISVLLPLIELHYMIIRITEYCDMGCTHCFIDSTPKGSHMPFDVFIQAVSFAIKLGINDIVISGGEPTSHPQFVDFMHYLTLNFQKEIHVCTHGMFADNPDSVANYIVPFPQVSFQIVNDPLYYPKSPNLSNLAMLIQKHKNISFFDHISANNVYPQGRARTRLGITELTTGALSSRCFNLRSLVNHESIQGIGQAIRALEERGYRCTPSVNINGSIGMGESNECPETAYISDSLDAIFESFKCSQCNDCGMLTKLDQRYKDAIGFRSWQFPVDN